jgi:hypothetical protein
VLLAGLRRFALIVLLLAGLAVVVGLLGAVLLHTGVRRSVSVALYGLGAFLLVSGFFHGIRPPLRVDEEQGLPSMFGILLTQGRLRTASMDERHESLSTSALFVVLGLLLIALGGAIDPVHGLF